MVQVEAERIAIAAEDAAGMRVQIAGADELVDRREPLRCLVARLMLTRASGQKRSVP